ncbi:hypothetical protein LINPERHAP2_LOCUS33712 [Linum perenne]
MTSSPPFRKELSL